MGRTLGSRLKAGDFIALHGELGSGKTRFVRGVAEALQVDPAEPVTSPTYSLLHIHNGRIPLYHFDLYRLRTAKEFTSMGFDEYFENGGITAIEWPERIASILPASAIGVHLTHISENVRRLVMP